MNYIRSTICSQKVVTISILPHTIVPVSGFDKNVVEAKYKDVWWLLVNKKWCVAYLYMMLQKYYYPKLIAQNKQVLDEPSTLENIWTINTREYIMNIKQKFLGTNNLKLRHNQTIIHSNQIHETKLIPNVKLQTFRSWNLFCSKYKKTSTKY